MQTDQPSRRELLERMQRFRKHADLISLGVGIVGLVVFIILGGLGPPWISGMWLIALIAPMVLATQRKSVYDQFGLICPHCSRILFGAWPYLLSRKKAEEVLATGQCAACGAQIISD